MCLLSCHWWGCEYKTDMYLRSHYCTLFRGMGSDGLPLFNLSCTTYVSSSQYLVAVVPYDISSLPKIYSSGTWYRISSMIHYTLVSYLMLLISVSMNNIGSPVAGSWPIYLNPDLSIYVKSCIISFQYFL